MDPFTWGLVLLVAIFFYVSTRRPRNFPPGLQRIPIIGQTIKGAKPRMEYWKTHKVLGMFIGSVPTVQLQDFKMAKDLFNREEWCGRGQGFMTRYLRSDSGRNRGIITTDGPEWTDQRRFALKHLKDFGFGRAGLEGVIQGEVEDLVELLMKHNQKDFKMDTVFGIPVINILWTIVAGHRFQSDDPKVERMMTLLNKLFKSKIALEYFFPVWGIFCYLVPGLNTRSRIIRELRGMFRKSISEHKSSRDPNHPRDFLDVYLAEMEKKENPNFDQESLELVCLDLFKAGAETTSTTLLWCVLYLTRYQGVQQAAREEVERVTGEERPSLSHHLPYCQAVIQEVQRLSCVVPQVMPHRVTKDVTVEGYKIPRDSFALANLTGFMQDPDVWDQPDQFRPERFLENCEGGVRLVKKEQFVPFGFGRRVCMGEALAKDTLTIFFATLIKQIRFEKPEAHAGPDPKNYTDGFTIIPKPYYVGIKHTHRKKASLSQRARRRAKL